MPVISTRDGTISTPDAPQVTHYPYPCPEPHGADVTCEEAVRRWAKRNNIHVVNGPESEGTHAG